MQRPSASDRLARRITCASPRGGRQYAPPSVRAQCSFSPAPDAAAQTSSAHRKRCTPPAAGSGACHPLPLGPRAWCPAQACFIKRQGCLQEKRFSFPTLQVLLGQKQRVTADASLKARRKIGSLNPRTIAMHTEHLCVTSQALSAVSGTALCQASYTLLGVGSRSLWQALFSATGITGSNT